MATMTDPPAERFRLSQLIYDTRYRSLTIQVVAMALLVLMLSWLVSNTVQNLEQLGKDFDFGFLAQPAGYDINQRLIEYDSQSTHGRAALVGILNTLLVAILGCALATVLGVIAGVLRLSKNWLVSRLMAVYVEGFRNVPLLLWIIAIFALMTESTPQPRDFREGGGAEMILGGSVAITNRGVYVPAPVWGDGASLLIGVFLLSLVGIWAFRRWAFARQERTGDILPVFRVSAALFFVPVLVAYFAIGLVTGRAEQTILAADGLPGATLGEFAEGTDRFDVCLIPGTATALNMERALRDAGVRYDVVPFAHEGEALRGFQVGDCNVISVPATQADPVIAETADMAPAPLAETIRRGNPVEFERPILGGFNFDGGLHLRNSLIALWLALALYTGAFIAEIVRGGILAISRGQTEAAYALGLRPNRTMNLVILPQALRVIIPPLISQYLNLTKNSSLAIAVGYMDVRSTLGGITINQTGRELEGMLLLGLFYLVLSLIISGAMNVYNSRVKLRER